MTISLRMNITIAQVEHDIRKNYIVCRIYIAVMKNEGYDEFPLVKKYLVKSARVQEQIRRHFYDDTIWFCQFWESVLQQVNCCEGFESRIKKTEKNPKQLFHILNEFREAAFLKSKEFSITFPAEGPDFIAEPQASLKRNIQLQN